MVLDRRTCFERAFLTQLQAGIASALYPDQVLIALEPEAASIFCRKLRLNQLIPDRPKSLFSDLKMEPKYGGNFESEDKDDGSNASTDFVLEETGKGIMKYELK